MTQVVRSVAAEYTRCALKLDLARVRGGSVLAERGSRRHGCAPRGVDSGEIHVVENVERFGQELDCVALSNWDPFGQTQVDGSCAGALIRVAADRVDPVERPIARAVAVSVDVAADCDILRRARVESP